MTAPLTPEALVDGDHDMPTDAEIEAMREEADNFRLPAPPPTPVRGRYYLTECEHCGWVGSSEHLGVCDDDISCPVCCRSICGDAPDEADTAKHGEAVYQRIVTAETALATATAEVARLRAEVEAKDKALKDERARRKAAVQSVREKAAALCDEAAAYFDRTTGHYDRDQAAGGYRATASKIRLLTPDRTALARAATAREGV